MEYLTKKSKNLNMNFVLEKLKEKKIKLINMVANKSLFIRVQFNDEAVSPEDLRLNLTEIFYNIPKAITTTFYESMAEDHADYIEYVINK